MNTLAAIALSDVVIWTYLLAARGGFWRAECNDAALPAPAVWPAVTIIIPARNEADILGSTLPTLLANDYAGSLNIVLVDDRSEDNTAANARQIAAKLHASQQLTVISATTMSDGWKGKVWAMQNGFGHVREAAQSPKYILFTDADIAYDAGAIARLVAQAEAQNNVLTSLMVQLRCASVAEQFLIAAFVYFFGMLYPFRWVNNGPRHAAAAGGCMLVRYEALQHIGGLAPIRAALIDDCALARALQPQGRISLELTQRVHSLRAYPKLEDIRSMVARTAYDQLRYSKLNLIGCIAGMMLVYLAPVLLTLFANGATQWLGIVAWALMNWSYLPILRFYRRPAWQALSLPLAALSYMAFTLDSAWQYSRGRGGMWKGRAQAERQAA